MAILILGLAPGLNGQFDCPIRGSLQRCDRYHGLYRQKAIDVREKLSIAWPLPAYGVTKPRQVHSGQRKAIDPAEMFVQCRGNLGGTRQVDVAIRNIHRRSVEYAVTLHLLQLRGRQVLDDLIRHGCSPTPFASVD